jgi:hypothetical protein
MGTWGSGHGPEGSRSSAARQSAPHPNPPLGKEPECCERMDAHEQPPLPQGRGYEANSSSRPSDRISNLESPTTHHSLLTQGFRFSCSDRNVYASAFI